MRWARSGEGTFETLKFSLQFLAELHLLQEQFLQFVCEGREWEVKEGARDSGCPPQRPSSPALAQSPEMGVVECWGREVEALYIVCPFASKGFGRGKRARRQVAQGN